MASNSIELGFLKHRASWKLLSKYFPSKVGGKPAWLRLNNLPDHANLQCSTCKKPLTFLMQVYAPVPEEKYTFHRTIFIFVCSNGKCCRRSNNESFVVFRNQLPCENEFYSSEPPVFKEKLSTQPSAEQYQPMCIVCGCMATLKCEKCNENDYCCEYHRSSDWETSHKDTCGKDQEATSKSKLQRSQLLLPEFELETDTEVLPPSGPEKSEQEKMDDYRQFMQSSKAPKEMQDMPLDDLDSNMKKDKAFNKFLKRINIEPEQVLRYQRGGSPLWVSSEHVPESKDIPDCSCGAKRVFEFQVMPQLLNSLSLDTALDSVDWGTLAIYTCSKSCETGTGNYVEEFLWKQDFSDDG